jgi:hypothetical protein
MSVIHGSRGLIYFVHQFKPEFNEAALLDDAEMLKAVTSLNREITGLASVIKSPAVTNVVMVQSENSKVPVAYTVRQQDGALYIFAVAMREGETTATFKLNGIKDDKNVEVINENRTINSKQGEFSDRFGAWDVHLYRIK